MRNGLLGLAARLGLAIGLSLAAPAGSQPGGPDADGDGVEDQFDNCTLVSNVDQKDIDQDGCGDRCDCDFNQDGACGVIPDFASFKASFGKSTGQPGYDPVTDMDCDGSVGMLDFSLFQSEVHTPAGPSGLPASMKTPIACP